jgi:serine/threonine-protein kinase
MSEQYQRVRTVLADRYLIEREVGRGGAATVYLAEDRKHRRPVAVKVLRPEVSQAVGPERFLREIEIVAALSHPHILPLYDSGDADGYLYYVMPYVEGGTLRDLMVRGGRVPVEETLRLAHQVAGALVHAHRHNIVHRDIKPENVLLSEGNALVTDFGIGKAVCDVCEDDHITVAGTPIGTPAYMSPEQSLGEAVDARSDIYSLACVLYEMLTGRPPFQGSTAQATLVLHAVKEPPSARELAPELPQYLDEALGRAMAKSPDDRYETVTEFVQALGLVSTAAVPAAGTPTCDNCGMEVLPGHSVCAHCGTQLIVRPQAGGRRKKRRWVAATVTTLGVVLSALGAWWLLGGTMSGAEQIESLAILPLANLSGDSAQGHFVDGMHDALIAEVAQIGTLKVISRTSVMRYRGSLESVPDIAEALGVDAVLEGSVVRSGDSVRIAAQLIAADPERHLWAGTYDRELRDVFSIYTEVARAIAREVAAELTPWQEARLTTPRPVDPVVLEAYLQGRYHASRGSVDGFRRAIGFFESAIARDSLFASAHSALALSTHLLGFYGGMPEHVAEPRAKAAAQRALELDGGLAEARAVLAGIRAMHEWDWRGAEREYERAIALDPSSAIARAWYAYYLTSMGRHEAAIAQARRSLELDPLNPTARLVLADQLLYDRQYASAIEELREALAHEPRLDRAWEVMEDAHTLAGDYDAAVAVRRQRLASGVSASTDAADLAQRYAKEGPSGYWRWRLELLERESELGYVPPSRLAQVHAALGETDAAVKWLERAYDARDAVELLQVSPYYDALRHDLRFQALVERMAFPD